MMLLFTSTPGWNQDIYTNSPGLSGSLLDADQISRSPVQVTKSPGQNK